MKKITRIFAVVLTAALAAMMCLTSVSASMFDTKNVLNSNEQKKIQLLSEGDYIDFKMNVSKSGRLSITYTSELGQTKLILIDSNGAEIKVTKNEINAGSGWYGGVGYTYVQNKCNEDTGIGNATVEWAVNSGTYYLRVSREQSSYGSGDIVRLTAKFPGGKSSSSNSSKVSSSSNATIKINMEVGDKIDLSAMSGNKEVNAKWTSSNSKVAKVSSKGKITALKEGTCTITWTSGSSTFTIYVEVE